MSEFLGYLWKRPKISNRRARNTRKADTKLKPGNPILLVAGNHLVPKKFSEFFDAPLLLCLHINSRGLEAGMPEYALQNIKRYSTSGRLRTEGVSECMRAAAA